MNQRPLKARAGWLVLVPAALTLVPLQSTEAAARAQSEPEGLQKIPAALITYKYAPEKLSDDTLKSALRQVIGSEQRQYAAIEQAKQQNVKPPHEDEFFLFTADQVVGRAPDFAAGELLGEYKAFLSKEAAAIPDQLRLDRYLSMAYFTYENGVINSDTSSGQGPDVFSRDSVETDQKKASIPALGAHELLLGGYALEAKVDASRFSKLPSRSGQLKLAIDRVPTVKPVAMPRDEAEKLFIKPNVQGCGKNPAYNSLVPGDAGSNSQAAVDYKSCIERIQRYSEGFMLSYVVTPEGFVEGTNILALHLNRVELYSPYGELMKTYPASELPAATDALAERRAEEQKAADEAAARKQATAKKNAAISAGLGAADIDGLNLSMSYAEAEAAIRKKLEIGRVRESKSSEKTMPYFDDMAQFENGDGSERIMLFRAGSGSQKLAGIGRWVDLPEGTKIDDVRDQLVAKYGEPTENYYSMGLTWHGFDDKRLCGSHVGWTHPPRIIEGKDIHGGYEQYGSIAITGSYVATGNAKNELAKKIKEKCSPQLIAMVQMSYLLVVLVDVSTYAAANINEDEPKKVELDL